MNVFIVTSCINAVIGKISNEDRYEQTLKAFGTIRKQVPNSIIVFCDSSVGGLEEDKKATIIPLVDHYLDCSADSFAQQVNSRGLKSLGETYTLKRGITFIKDKLNINEQTGRMFKITGRCILLEKFTMDDYTNADGKYVFKKRVESWMDKNIQQQFGSTHILETRFYSWDIKLVDEYLAILDKNFELLNRGFDTEHAHFLNIPKDKLLEFDFLNMGGQVAGYTHAFYRED